MSRRLERQSAQRQRQAEPGEPLDQLGQRSLVLVEEVDRLPELPAERLEPRRRAPRTSERRDRSSMWAVDDDDVWLDDSFEGLGGGASPCVLLHRARQGRVQALPCRRQ